MVCVYSFNFYVFFLFSLKKNIQSVSYVWHVFMQDKFTVLHFSSSPLPPLFLSAPCPLQTFLSAVNCSDGIVSVTWNNSVPGVVHTVSAVDTTGHRHNCSGTSSGCDLSTLKCGTEYNITITPSRNGCVGKDSPTKMITTGKEQWHFQFTRRMR